MRTCCCFPLQREFTEKMACCRQERPRSSSVVPTRAREGRVIEKMLSSPTSPAILSRCPMPTHAGLHHPTATSRHVASLTREGAATRTGEETAKGTATLSLGRLDTAPLARRGRDHDAARCAGVRQRPAIGWLEELEAWQRRPPDCRALSSGTISSSQAPESIYSLIEAWAAGLLLSVAVSRR